MDDVGFAGERSKTITDFKAGEKKIRAQDKNCPKSYFSMLSFEYLDTQYTVDKSDGSCVSSQNSYPAANQTDTDELFVFDIPDTPYQYIGQVDF